MIDYFVELVLRGRDYYHWTSGTGYLRGFLMRLESKAPRAAVLPAEFDLRPRALPGTEIMSGVRSAIGPSF